MPLVFVGGQLLIRNNRLIVADNAEGACKCCCDPTPCGEITLRYVDENRCEDDVFDIYVYNPTTNARRLIGTLDMKSDPPGCCNTDDDGNPCPQTTVELKFTPTPDDIGDNCYFGIQAEYKSPNCCGTLAKFTLIGPSGTRVDSQYFTTAGLKQEFKISDVCSECDTGSCAEIAFETRVTFTEDACEQLSTGITNSPVPGSERYGGFWKLIYDRWLSSECMLTIEIRPDNDTVGPGPHFPYRALVTMVCYDGESAYPLPTFPQLPSSRFAREVVGSLDLSPLPGQGNADRQFTVTVGKHEVQVPGTEWPYSIDHDKIAMSVTGWQCPSTVIPTLALTYPLSQWCFE